MRLGNLFIENPFVQAPMAGVTDSAFRTIARRFHDGLLFTEMISAEALCRGNWRTLKYLDVPDEHRPISVQLVGNDPKRVAQAAALVQDLGIDFIDINAGCPQQKVVGPGSGGALLKNPDKLASMVRSVKAEVGLPVSVKIRLGHAKDDSLALGSLLQESGADFITIHGRTVAQKYTGKADWDAIKGVVKALDIPVLANGDAKDEASACRMIRETGAQGVMIGRATRGRPDLPGTAFSLLEFNSYERMPMELLARTILDHASLEQDLFGDESGMRRMRKHVHWYLRSAGLKCPAAMIFRLETMEQLVELVDKHVYNPAGQ